MSPIVALCLLPAAVCLLSSHAIIFQSPHAFPSPVGLCVTVFLCLSVCISILYVSCPHDPHSPSLYLSESIVAFLILRLSCLFVFLVCCVFISFYVCISLPFVPPFLSCFFLALLSGPCTVHSFLQYYVRLFACLSVRLAFLAFTCHPCVWRWEHSTFYLSVRLSVCVSLLSFVYLFASSLLSASLPFPSSAAVYPSSLLLHANPLVFQLVSLLVCLSSRLCICLHITPGCLRYAPFLLLSSIPHLCSYLLV